MNSLLYFIAAVVLTLGLMYFGGYMGHESQERTYGGSENMNRLLTGSSSGNSGGCASCRWS